MAINDHISNMLARIRNAQMGRFEQVELPSTRTLEQIARILKEEGFVKNYRVVPDSAQPTLRIYLRTDPAEGYAIKDRRKLRRIAEEWNIETADRTDTFMVGSKVTLIPGKLYVDGNFTYSRSTSEWDLSCTPNGCRYSPLAVFPDSHNTLTRLDVAAKYIFDEGAMRSVGWNGKAFIKARVLWEKNSNDAWQPLQDQLGWLVNPTNTTTAYSIWTGSGNPNYTAIVGQVSMGLKW